MTSVISNVRSIRSDFPHHPASYAITEFCTRPEVYKIWKKLISNLSTLSTMLIPNAYGNVAFLAMTKEQWKKRICAIHNIDFNNPVAVLAAKNAGTLTDKPVVTPPAPF